MTQRPGWRPEHTLTTAMLVLIGAFLVAAVVVVVGMMGGRRIDQVAPAGLVIVGGGVVAALAIGAYGRKLRRSQRPEWLETQAWQSGLQEKLEQDRKQREEGRTGQGRKQP
jgi:flagellar motor component MotA